MKKRVPVEMRDIMNDLFVPNPILSEEEEKRLVDLQKKYDKLVEPNALIKTGKKVGTKVARAVPSKVKDIGTNLGETLSATDFYKKAIEYATAGFVQLEQLAAKVTVSEKRAVQKVNKTIMTHDIESLNEICFARANDIAKIVNGYRSSDVLLATLEGAGTGALGFAGLIPNFVASTFLYFRAVQSVAMYYGYDVKNDASEMEIASAVMMSAFDPKTDAANNELTAMIGKFMVFTETTAVKQASKKTWEAMIEHGGLGLLIAQIRALSNSAAKKALQSAGKKGLEQKAFKNILEQLGKKATLKNTSRAMPVLGAAFGALFDTAQMKKIIDYADIFYSKRFIEEKEVRINSIIHPEGIIEPVIIDLADEEQITEMSDCMETE